MQNHGQNKWIKLESYHGHGKYKNNYVEVLEGIIKMLQEKILFNRLNSLWKRETKTPVKLNAGLDK